MPIMSCKASCWVVEITNGFTVRVFSQICKHFQKFLDSESQ